MVYDVLGQLVHVQEFNLVAGMNQLRVNTAKLSAGNNMFTVVLAANGKVLLTKKMIKN
jgi:X-X-X-Leu-X-X-Gly heptad repeat protein